MINVRNIILIEEEMRKCREFSERCALNQQPIKFGERTTMPRPVQKIARDNLIGKIAETAFRKMMKENYGIEIELDFNYYPRGQWDDQDAVVNGWRIDVKSTKVGGKWLLVEWNKLNFRQRGDKLSHVYVMLSVGWDHNADQPTGHVSYEGFVTLARLGKQILDTEIILQNSCIPGTLQRLDADNYGIPISKLFRNPYDLYILLTQYRPSEKLTQNFKNPFTDQTYAEIVGKSKKSPQGNHQKH